jgi:cholesterol transport system auxiliary component
MMRIIFLRAAAVAAVLALSLTAVGCALTQKATPAAARYFSPELPSGKSPSSTSLGPALELRLGRITAGAHLRERIVFRDSKYELGFYEDLRWTERPDTYLRRALSQVLFSELGLRSVLSGAAPVLDVELVRFEEVRQPRHVAALELSFALRDERVVRRAQTVTIELPIPETDKSAAAGVMAATLGEALRSAVAQLGERIRGDLMQAQPNIATAPSVASKP